MNAAEASNIEVVRRYFAGCQSGDLEAISGTLDADVIHYFLPARFPPITGALALAKYWRAYKLALNPVWSVDHLLARDDEVVSEWSCIWTPRRTDRRLMLRGSEWYVMRNGKIAEIRAYFMSADDANCELAGFPYAERGYLDVANDCAEAGAAARRSGRPPTLLAHGNAVAGALTGGRLR